MNFFHLSFTDMFKSVFMMLLMMFLLTACGPPKVDKWVDTASHETVFVIPLESPSDQKQVLSVDYLNKLKVSTQRIFLSQKKVDTGRWWFSYAWIPTAKVITVSRQPVRMLLEEKSGIKVESKDSINFTVGIDTTAHIDEKNTALFLYNFPSGDLGVILGGTVKSKATEILSREFAKFDLAAKPAKVDKDGKVIIEAIPGAREQKGEIVATAKADLIEYFKDLGVTIDTFGLVGGLWYEDPKIQASINANFNSAIDVENKHNERLAQDEINVKTLAIAATARKAAEEFAKAKEAQTAQVGLEIQRMTAEANLTKAQRWNGALPSMIMPDGAGFIVDTKSGK